MFHSMIEIVSKLTTTLYNITVTLYNILMILYHDICNFRIDWVG